MKTNTFLCVLCLFLIGFSSYIPELILTTTADYFNKQLSINVGPKVT